MREPENPVRSAYMKLLREHDKTKRVYPINPYAEVYQFRDNLYGIFTENADGVADPWIYLLVGPKKAMLFDTGYGIGDLKGLVSTITGDMPLLVVNTHGHPDHAYGNCQFDRVYCHEYEVDFLRAQERPGMWDYLIDENKHGKWMQFDPEDIIPYREYELIGCKNGHTFDLGEGYTVEMIFLPGHTAGHAVYLDRQNRILFGGDDMCIGVLHMGFGSPGAPHREEMTVTAFHRELKKLCGRLNEFDGIFPGHGIVDIGSAWLLDVLETCEKILADPENCDHREEMQFADYQSRYAMKIHDSGYLTYLLDCV